MRHILVKYCSNWADEFDIQGFAIMNDEEYIIGFKPGPEKWFIKKIIGGKKLAEKNNETVVKEVIKTSDTSAAYVGEEQTGENGAYNIVVKARKETSDGLNITGSDILVIGSPFMFDNSVISSANTYNNASVLLNVINETTGKEASAVIPEKVFDQYTLSLTQGSARLILVVVVVIIPLLIGIAGLCVLLWRKNK